jgi:putative heme-binding domain-containing protein
LNTGGWFRIGCPASLMAKPDMLGAVYRIQSNKPVSEKPVVWRDIASPAIMDLKSAIKDLKSKSPHARLHALEWIAQHFDGDLSRDEVIDSDSEIAGQRVRRMMAETMDPVLEHALICAARKLDMLAVSEADMRKEANPLVLRRMLLSFVTDCLASVSLRMGIAQGHLDSPDRELANVALGIVLNSPDADPYVAPELLRWLDEKNVSHARIETLESFCTALIAKPETQKIIAAMLKHPSMEVRGSALNILASQTTGVTDDSWFEALEKMLAETPTPLLLDAIKKLKNSRFDVALQTIADDTKRPLSIRLKALDSTKAIKLNGDTFGMVKGVLGDASSSAAARIQAAMMLANAPLEKEQQESLAPLLASAGPVELEKILPLLRKSKDAGIARVFATELAKNPAIASQQESVYRTAFSVQPPEIFETIVRPALEVANAATLAKKRLLAPLAGKAAATGDAQAGRLVYESGKGACIACHRIGDKGRPIGPDLSKIGAIRTERDLVESILFPSNTLARDYEAHIIETSGGETITGVIKSHTAEGLLVVDVAGQEKNVPHQSITGNTTLTTSLMPMGLDQTLPEQDLLNLVAFLRSLK